MGAVILRGSVACELVGVPDQPVPYSSAGRTYSPRLADFTCAVNDGAWVIASAKVSGPYRLKDGSLGQNRAEARYYSFDRMPEWLAAPAGAALHSIRDVAGAAS